MPVVPRPDLAAIPPYIPGRSAPGSIKLASNETTAPPLPSVLSAVAAAAQSANRYPDISATATKESIASSVGTTADRVAVGCGSVALCQQLAQALCQPGDEVIFPWRSFEAYPIITKIAHAKPVPVPLTSQHELDLHAMARSVTDKTRLIFVCTPNNPTGTALTAKQLREFIALIPPSVVIAVDEAYVEYARGDDPVDAIALTTQYDNVASLRTFSKAYGLAGLRVGYLVADHILVDAVNKMMVPFSVSSVAQVAARVALDAQAELLERTNGVRTARERLRAQLIECGFSPPPSEANFLWLPIGKHSAELTSRCAERGILVRGFSGDGVRITVGEQSENEQLMSVIAEIIHQSPELLGQPNQLMPTTFDTEL